MTPITNPPQTGRKGRITYIRTVHCADCVAWDRALEGTSDRRARSHWMAIGWV